MSSQDLLKASSVILDSLSDGVYVCDRDRRIVFWSKAADKHKAPTDPDRLSYDQAKQLGLAPEDE